MRKLKSGGGWQAILYTLRMARRVGLFALWQAMRSKNACKTCALGMGGQLGGMRNESGHFPEVCKKSLQAMVADMQGAVPGSLFRKNSVKALQSLTPKEAEHLGRLTKPLLLASGSKHYQEVSWERAFEVIVGRLKHCQPARSFFYASGRSSNEAAFLLQLFARIYGTNNVNNCSYFCHQASGAGLEGALGTGTATVRFEDVEHADLFFLIGGNPASNHPRLMTALMRLKRNGGKVVVINPLKETGLVSFRVPSDVRSFLFGTKIADRYLQCHAGGDLALLFGIAKHILEVNAVDTDFVMMHTNGFEEFQAAVDKVSWLDLVRQSGIAEQELRHTAELYLRSKNTIFSWTMGITQHLNGVDNVRAIINLALMRGMVGKPRAGLLPIRGHSNVQGIGTVGVTPRLKDAVLQRLEAHYGLTLPPEKGMDSMACMEAADRGEIDFALCLGGNLWGATPDSSFAARAMSKIDTLVYLSTTLNQGHFHGLGKQTLVLPVLARDEETQSTTQESMFNFVRLSDGGKPRHVGPMGEVQILATVAESVIGTKTPIDWHAMHDHQKIRDVIGAVVPGLSGLLDIDKTKQEFQINGRTFHEPIFPTKDGKASFHACALPKEQTTGFRLMTIRSEGQFNTVVYEDYDLYRAQDRRDVVLMNNQDMRELGISENSAITIRSKIGVMTSLRARSFDIRSGNVAMYYPESNVLVPIDRDPISKTPSFKSIPVEILPE